MKSVLWRPLALRDADEAAAWYASQGGLALELVFIDALQDATDRIHHMPGIGSMRHAPLMPDTPVPLRFHPIARFDRYLIYYLDHPELLEIVRVFNASRGLSTLVDSSDFSATPHVHEPPP